MDRQLVSLLEAGHCSLPAWYQGMLLDLCLESRLGLFFLKVSMKILLGPEKDKGKSGQGIVRGEKKKNNIKP